MYTISFQWEKGSLNDNGIKLLRAHHIRYCYSYEKLYAKYNGHWLRVEYRKTSDNNWIMELMEIPPKYRQFAPSDTF